MIPMSPSDEAPSCDLLAFIGAGASCLHLVALVSFNVSTWVWSQPTKVAGPYQRCVNKARRTSVLFCFRFLSNVDEISDSQTSKLHARPCTSKITSQSVSRAHGLKSAARGRQPSQMFVQSWPNDGEPPQNLFRHTLSLASKERQPVALTHHPLRK